MQSVNYLPGTLTIPRLSKVTIGGRYSRKRQSAIMLKKLGGHFFLLELYKYFFLCKTFLLNILTFNFVTTTRPFLFRIIIVIKTNAYFFNTNFLRIFLRWIGKKLSVYTLYNNNKAQKPRRTRPGFREERAVLWISKKIIMNNRR